MSAKELSKEQYIKACEYSRKFFNDNFFNGDVKWSEFKNCPLVEINKEYRGIDGTIFNTVEYFFNYDVRSKIFYYRSYYHSLIYRLNDYQNNEILNYLKCELRNEKLEQLL